MDSHICSIVYGKPTQRQMPKLHPLLHSSQMESRRRSRRIAGLEPEHYKPQKQESMCLSVLVITAGILFCSAVVPILFKTFE